MSTYNIAKNSISGINALVSTLNYVPPFNEHGKQILEPLNCMIKLALLSFKEKNTKISICNNRIDYQTFNIFQGAMRWTNGDKRSDLHNLYEPIKKALKWYNIYNKKISFIFNLSINGLKSLKQTYQDENTNNSNLVCHSLAYYINIITTTLMKLELDINEAKRIKNISIDNDNKNNKDNNEQKNNSNNNVEINNSNKSKKKKKKKNRKTSDNIPINMNNNNHTNGKKRNSFMDDSNTYDEISSDGDEEENKLRNNIDNIQSDIQNLYDSLNNQSDNEYDYNNKDNIKSRKYTNHSKHEGYKLSNIWIEKEIDIIYHILTLIYEKCNNKENYDYLLDSAECILREKDERVYSIIQKISTSLGK